MIDTRPAPCFRMDPDPHPDVEMHFTELQYAEKALRDLAEGTPGTKIGIVQERIPCGHLACDGCGSQYEDDEEGTYHIQTDQEEALAKEAAVDGANWTVSTDGKIHCATCPPFPPQPGPGPDDQPLPLPEAP